MKKKAIKIAASTAVAASAFVAAAPAQQADAATNVNQLVTDAQNAGTVLKWAISVEGSADYKTAPHAQYNAAKKAVAAAEKAAEKLSSTEKLSIQAKLVEPKIQITRAQAYIDALTSSSKIVGLTTNLDAAVKSADLGKVEAAYHTASAEYRKQAALLDRVYGQSTRDGIRNAVKPALEKLMGDVKYDVTVKMHLDKASALIKENKLEEAAAELAKADYNLTLKDAKFTFKSQLEKSFADVSAALPLQAVSAVGDGKNTVTVKFSKAYDKLTTLEAGQFKISGLTVQSAKLADDKKSVVLTTSTQSAGKEYTVTWQGKSVKFTTPTVGDTSGIVVNQTDVAYLETTQTRTYEATITNADGTPYVGDVEVKLATSVGSAVVTSVNGVNKNTATVTSRTDVNGKLYFNVGATSKTASALKVVPTITKLDGSTGKKDRELVASYFYQLQETDTNVGNTGFIETRGVASKIDAGNDYIYVKQNDKKYKWDSNDLFFIAGSSVSQETFEKELTRGDSLTIDYKAKADEKSSFNIVNNQTLAEGLEFTNPVNEEVRFDGSNYDLSGKGDAGYTVKVYKGQTFVGSTTVNSDGTWTLRAVNLTQNAVNEFTAYLLPAGKDNSTPWNGVNVEDKGSVKILEGAFASTSITLKDNSDNGVSVSDTLTFSFLNSQFNHEFKKDLTGTITVTDGLSRKATFEVEYVNANTLEIVKVVSAETGFQNNSKTVTIESTTGIVNQDELAYNVKASTGKTLNTNGSTANNAGKVTFNAGNVIDVNGVAYTFAANAVLRNELGILEVQGAANVQAGVPVNTEVFDIVADANNVISSLKYKAAVADKTAATTVQNEIAALGATPTKAAVTAADGKYTALTAVQKNLVTNYTTLKVFVDDITAGGLVNTTLAGLSNTSTNKVVKDARAAYNDLKTLGKAEVVAANLTKLTDAETALAASKSALASKISAANTLYTQEATLLNGLTALEKAGITALDPSEPDAYTALVGALNAAKTAAVNFAVEADAATTTTIDGQTSSLDTAVTNVTGAKAAFDALVAQVRP